MSHRGMVVAGHHAAAEAGVQVLRAGGNAMDAAITGAAVLSVAIPPMNSLGGDCFALWFDRGRGATTVVNGSGGAPRQATIEAYRAHGLQGVPERGPLSISVPGVVGAWAECLQRFGTISLERALGPAIELAETGIIIDRVLREFFNGPNYAQLAGTYPGLQKAFGPAGGRRLGEVIAQPALAGSLRQLGTEGLGAFYGGSLGQRLARDVSAAGGLLSVEDLATHRTLFQDPLRVLFRGHEVLTAPPNTQGIALSLLLGLAEARGALPPPPWLAQFMRWKEAAFATRDRELGDPELATPLQRLLRPEALAQAAASQESDATRARRRIAGGPAGGDTSTLVAIDEAGNAVSWVQSIFKDFGSGVVSESTGILLQNRLHLASLRPGHANSLAPGRRPFHTLCPALLLRDGACRLAIATPGDHGQPQTLAQVIVNLLERGMDVQEAIEAPRIRHDAGKEILYEDRLDPAEVEGLEQAGYTLRDVGPWSRLMGGANAIYCRDGGVRMGGADPRRASYAVAY